MVILHDEYQVRKQLISWNKPYPSHKKPTKTPEKSCVHHAFLIPTKTFPKTNSKFEPENFRPYLPQKEAGSSSSPIHFQGRTVSFGGVISINLNPPQKKGQQKQQNLKSWVLFQVSLVFQNPPNIFWGGVWSP